MNIAVDIDGHPLLLAATNTPAPQPGDPTTKTVTRSGNPWHATSGKFGNSPPGVSVREGGNLLPNILNAGKRFISQRATQLGANEMAATQGKNGHISITLYRNGQAVAQFEVPSQATPARVANISEGNTVQPVDHTASAIPPGVDPEEWARRMDAVRAAAREFDQFGHGDIQEFLKGRVLRDLSPDEIDSFVRDVHDHRLNDLVDVLEGTLRRQSALTNRMRRVVKVTAPRGFVQRSLNGLTDDDVAKVVNRLEIRGLNREDTVPHIVKRFIPTRRDLLAARLGGSTK